MPRRILGGTPLPKNTIDLSGSKREVAQRAPVQREGIQRDHNGNYIFNRGPLVDFGNNAEAEYQKKAGEISEINIARDNERRRAWREQNSGRYETARSTAQYENEDWKTMFNRYRAGINIGRNIHPGAWQSVYRQPNNLHDPNRNLSTVDRINAEARQRGDRAKAYGADQSRAYEDVGYPGVIESTINNNREQQLRDKYRQQAITAQPRYVPNPMEDLAVRRRNPGPMVSPRIYNNVPQLATPQLTRNPSIRKQGGTISKFQQGGSADQAKQILVADFAVRYLKGIGVPETEIMDQSGSSINPQYMEEVTAVIQEIDQPEFWTAYESSPDEVVNQYIQSKSPEAAQMARKGAKLKRLSKLRIYKK